MHYFFYGTLMDRDLLEAVVGHKIPPIRLEGAILDGFRRVCARGANYPVILPMEGRSVQGVLLKNVTSAEAQKIRVYEGMAYREDSFSAHVKAGTVYAEVFVPKSDQLGSSMPWDFDTWKDNYKKSTLALLKQFA